MKLTKLIKQTEFYLKKLLELGCSYRSEHIVTDDGVSFESIQIFDKRNNLMSIQHSYNGIAGLVDALIFISIYERNKNLSSINSPF